jgi:hypothetical protein
MLTDDEYAMIEKNTIPERFEEERNVSKSFDIFGNVKEDETPTEGISWDDIRKRNS